MKMTKADSELANKIVYLKDNNYMPNIDDETPEVQRAIRSYYYGESLSDRTGVIIKDSPFWFTLAFCEYQVTDKFVREVNKSYKLFQIKNIGKMNSEFGF